MPSDQIIAIIPASGKGRRFGMPKAEAVLAGKSFADIIKELLHSAGIAQVHCPKNLETGSMLETLRHAISELKDQQALGYLIHPVDHPFVKASTIKLLIETFKSLPDSTIRPSFQGKSGHPVIVPSWLNIDADDNDKGLAGLIRSQVCTVIDIPVDDEGVLRNINSPEALHSLEG
ncbi:MAG: NTP transferase domain-containing protein [Candidatus Cloacimonadaceae bacterium]|nr:NTP transferase domain-containing protein [Candidatus Cloacimonadaceae bacterium]MDP3114821.1 NTP transferase domain-containing protein [Candidatus Cloacimonadaceae bacterium]